LSLASLRWLLSLPLLCAGVIRADVRIVTLMRHMSAPGEPTAKMRKPGNELTLTGSNGEFR
jgi:hypothetical protein